MGELQTLLALVVLIYVLCVIVQAVQEVVKAVLNTKAKTMAATINQFMGSQLDLKQVQDALEKRGLGIAALEQFNTADFRKLLDGIQFTAQQIQQIPSIVTTAGAGVDQLKDHIAASYDAALARFQQSYAKANKIWVIGISLVVVLALNASVINIYNILSVDQNMSQAIAGTAPTVAGAGQSSPAGDASQDATVIYAKNRAAIQKDLKDYPVLLRTSHYRADFEYFKSLKAALKEIAGLLLMVFLVSLGAPFWNDVLKGATGVNNTLNTKKNT